jgi:DNA-binding transcriptional ArsR family regulator
MSNVLQVAGVAAMVGDPARANMLLALSDGRSLPAGELAHAARVSAATASGHLARLVGAGLLSVTPQGRHRYYRIASAGVAALLEQMMAVAAEAPQRRRVPSRADAALREARTCYDHLAGRLGVALADSLAASGRVVLTEDGGEVTPDGLTFLADLGVDVARPRTRPFCRPCLDWSERRPHLAGHVGAALCRRCLDLGWIARQRDSRAVTVTGPGRQAFRSLFHLRDGA